MKVVYEVYIEDENYDTPPTRIELIFSELTTLEEKILKENNFKYEYTDENKVKIRDENFIYCSVEIDNENKGIFLVLDRNGEVKKVIGKNEDRKIAYTYCMIIKSIG